MEFIEPSYEILTPIDRDYFYSHCEKIARKCYKSENKITQGSAEKLIRNLIKMGHEAMIEHAPTISVNFIHNRGFSHEMVRHRLCSFAQESQRYVKYENSNMQFITPYWLDKDKAMIIPEETIKYKLFIEACENCEKNYKFFRNMNVKAQEARDVLINDIKTEIVVTTNIREWRNIFKLRIAPDAHPDMHRVMKPLLKDLYNQLPAFFYDIYE